MTSWSETQSEIARARETLERMAAAAGREDAIAVARLVNATADHWSEIGTQAVEHGLRAGLTQKRLAAALGVPASTLRGARGVLLDEEGDRERFGG